MRLSTNMLYELGIRGVQGQQVQQMDLQQKISAGRRVLKPSDDPIASSAILGVTQAAAVNNQYALNAQNAQATLSLEESALGDATRVLQDMKKLIIQAGNPVLSSQDRGLIAIEVKVLYEELMGIANRKDGTDQFIFSGYQGSTQPFAETAPGVVAYSGDDGQRLAQIGSQRRVAMSDSGSEVFKRIREGNGVFVTQPTLTNTGSATVGEGTILNPAAWSGGVANNRDYTVNFDVSAAVPPVTTYDIVDNVTGLSKLTGLAPAPGPHTRTYTNGGVIDMRRLPGDPIVAAWDSGVQVNISGAPATGDAFVVKSAQTKDVFSTAYDLYTTLNTATPSTPATRALYDSNLNAISSSLDRAMERISTTRASTGVRLHELDTAVSTATDLGLSYTADLSRLQDLDYAAALSELTQRQFNLEAAQKSYVAITQLKLFDFL
ncbi:MAG: flagellar hook-associated protein FlgL [Pseudomonadota bacterium]